MHKECPGVERKQRAAVDKSDSGRAEQRDGRTEIFAVECDTHENKVIKEKTILPVVSLLTQGSTLNNSSDRDLTDELYSEKQNERFGKCV